MIFTPNVSDFLSMRRTVVTILSYFTLYNLWLVNTEDFVESHVKTQLVLVIEHLDSSLDIPLNMLFVTRSLRPFPWRFIYARFWTGCDKPTWTKRVNSTKKLVCVDASDQPSNKKTFNVFINPVLLFFWDHYKTVWDLCVNNDENTYQLIIRNSFYLRTSISESHNPCLLRKRRTIKQLERNLRCLSQFESLSVCYIILINRR